MLKCIIALGLALTVTLSAGATFAQPTCNVGVYADAAGTVNLCLGLEIPPSLGSGDTNETVGLGECAVGFGGAPLVIARYTCLVVQGFYGGTVCLSQHDELFTEPGKAQVKPCSGTLRSCELGPCLSLESGVANDVSSFGSIKALYGN